MRGSAAVPRACRAAGPPRSPAPSGRCSNTHPRSTPAHSVAGRTPRAGPRCAASHVATSGVFMLPQPVPDQEHLPLGASATTPTPIGTLRDFLTLGRRKTPEKRGCRVIMALSRGSANRSGERGRESFEGRTPGPHRRGSAAGTPVGGGRPFARIRSNTSCRWIGTSAAASKPSLTFPPWISSTVTLSTALEAIDTTDHHRFLGFPGQHQHGRTSLFMADRPVHSRSRYPSARCGRARRLAPRCRS